MGSNQLVGVRIVSGDFSGCRVCSFSSSRWGEPGLLELCGRTVYTAVGVVVVVVVDVDAPIVVVVVVVDVVVVVVQTHEDMYVGCQSRTHRLSNTKVKLYC